jgi:ACS family hexuronate transporter-like MFS transporter
MASQRLLSRKDRSLGNSLIHSGASLGAILTPLVVQAMATDVVGSWRGPFWVIGALGVGWAVAWLVMIREGDLALDRSPDDAKRPETSPSSHASLARRFLVLAVVVALISFCWHLYQAWLPKMIREQLLFSGALVNSFSSIFHVAAGVGCLGAGFAARHLITRGRSIHGAWVLVFLACALLTVLGPAAHWLPAGPVRLGVLLLVTAGAFGLFPIFYSLAQELSTRHMGTIAGVLVCIAWISSNWTHWLVVRLIDPLGESDSVPLVVGLLPLGALLVLRFCWDRAPAEPLGASPGNPNSVAG